MTDKQNNSVARSLAAATCALLGTAPAGPVHAHEEPRWDFNTSFLYYGESDGRVQDTSLILVARRLFEDDRKLTLSLTIDALTGASPNGGGATGYRTNFYQTIG